MPFKPSLIPSSRWPSIELAKRVSALAIVSVQLHVTEGVRKRHSDAADAPTSTRSMAKNDDATAVELLLRYFEAEATSASEAKDSA